MKSFARRVSDGRMLKLIKAWLEMPVEEDDGKGGKRRTNRARKERKGTPQGAPISPLASNLYMRRFILGWKVLGYARRFRSEIVNYADDLCVLGKAPAADMLAAVERLMAGLKLPVNGKPDACGARRKRLSFWATASDACIARVAGGPTLAPGPASKRPAHQPQD